MRIELHALGRLEVKRSDGKGLPPAILQPKRLALLAYLALASPEGIQHRDTLLALLWPDHDEARARNALNQALHWLRRGLGRDALLSLGKDRLALCHERVWCDARAFEAACDAGSHAEALAFYRGDLLVGFHVSNLADFDAWGDGERRRLRRRAHAAAGALADEAEAAGNVPGAARWLRRQLALSPLDEAVLRRLLRVRIGAGDRASARVEYQEFEELLARNYGLEPSPETRAVLDGLSSDAVAVPDAGPATEAAEPKRGSEGPASIRSLAVLPLRNLSGDPGQDYFADGMTDALITELGKVGALRVISRQSTLPFKGSDKPVREIAGILGVDALVEGSVLKDGDRVRITLKLLRTEPETHLWSESYERALRDILALQGEIARTVAGEVEVALTPAETERLTYERPVNPRAFEACLRGRHFQNLVMPRELGLSIKYFREAVEIDPSYASAHAGLAICHCTLGILAYLSPDEALPVAAAASGTAVALEDTLAEAHVSLAWTSVLFHWDWRAAERACRRALDLNPGSVDAHTYHGVYLTLMGRFEEALDEAAWYRSVAPLDPASHWVLGWVNHKAKRNEEAIQAFDEALEFHPSLASVYPFLAASRLLAGDRAGAVEAVHTGLAFLPEDQLSLGYGAWTLARAGERDEALALLERLHGLEGGGWLDPYYVAVPHVGLGDLEAAADWLERCYARRSPSTAHFGSDPLLDPVRSHPRFRKLLRRLRFSKQGSTKDPGR